MRYRLFTCHLKNKWIQITVSFSLCLILIITMWLMSFSKFPPSLCTPELPIALSQELNAAALVPMDAFLLQVLPLRPFAEAVLQQDLRK